MLRFLAVAAAVATAHAVEHQAGDDDEALLDTVSLLQLHLGQTAPQKQHLPMEMLAAVGSGGAEPWKLFPAGAPGETEKGRREETVPVNIHDPSFTACGGMVPKHGYPKDYLDGHWTYNVSEPQLLPFVVPMGSPGRKDAAVVIAPGGAGRFLAIDTEGRDIAEWLNSLGISAFVLKYRTSITRRVDVRPETQRAVSMVRSRAAELGLNTSRIGFMGFSHGGFVTLNASVTFERQYARIDAVDDFAFLPDFSLPIYPEIQQSVFRAIAEMPQKVAPVFVAIAEDDPCCPVQHALELYGVLADGQAEASEMHIFPHGGHGYSMCQRSPDVQVAEGYQICTWPRNAEAFLRDTVLGGQRIAAEAEHHRLEAKYPRFARELDEQQGSAGA